MREIDGKAPSRICTSDWKTSGSLSSMSADGLTDERRIGVRFTTRIGQRRERDGVRRSRCRPPRKPRILTSLERRLAFHPANLETFAARGFDQESRLPAAALRAVLRGVICQSPR